MHKILFLIFFAIGATPLKADYFELMSQDFAQMGVIPDSSTCRNKSNISPQLSWKNAPQGTKSFVLVVEDPDAPHGTWDHWILFNIPETFNHLDQGGPFPSPIQEGLNGWGEKTYRGPCPPSGTHRYFFNLYALDTIIPLETGASKKEILKAMEGHILAETSLMGTYSAQAHKL